MDVTPQELRDIEIRESFRGYHRDDVDELLERAAGTIEHLEHQIRILQERLATGSAPEPRREPERAPAPPPVPVAAPVPVPDSDVIQRTLILAQRAADEAVTEAQARAAQVTGEAEAKAQAVMAEAESTARRIAETERRRIETEIIQLAQTRDALNADVDALEAFSSEYRDRIRRAIEAELMHLTTSSAANESFQPRPLLRSGGMVLPLATAPVAEIEPAPEPAPVSAPEPEPAPPAATTAAPEPTAPVPVMHAEPEPEIQPPWATSEPAWSPEPTGGWEPPPPTGNESAGGTAATGVPAPPVDEWGSESLDDDAFFASLRDAVRNDEPLGPRDGYDDELEDPDESRKLFRRRR